MTPCFIWPRRRPNHRIALDRLPYDVLKEILQYLPFDQRVRIARVNRRFQVISEMTISQTKTFHMMAPCFQRITTESMAKLIESCVASMKNLIIQVDTIEELAVFRERFQLLFGGFSLPRLTTIILETGNGTSSLFGVIQEILVKIQSLRSLKWKDHLCGIDDTQQLVACERLERVDLKFWDPTSPPHFTSFLNNCSNLKHLALRGDAAECVATMNGMDSLQSLILDSYDYKQFFDKIPVSFPQLVDLKMHLCYRRGVESEAGWLATLKNLRNIKIDYLFDDLHFNTDALQLTRCECLQIAELLGHDLNPMTVHAFTRHCSQLRKLTVRNILGIDSATDASAFVLSLAGFVQQDLTIVLERGDSNVWQCPKVKSALKKINQRPYRRISIDVANVDRRVRPKKRWWQKMIGWILSSFRRSKQ